MACTLASTPLTLEECKMRWARKWKAAADWRTCNEVSFSVSCRTSSGVACGDCRADTISVLGRPVPSWSPRMAATALQGTSTTRGAPVASVMSKRRSRSTGAAIASTVTCTRKSDRAAATAVIPCTTACSPCRITFPGAEALGIIPFFNQNSLFLFIFKSPVLSIFTNPQAEAFEGKLN